MRNIKLLLLLCLIFVGCETLEWTPQEKLKLYGCNYVPEANGFCCKRQVPESDHYIFDCKYTEWYEKQKDN